MNTFVFQCLRCFHDVCLECKRYFSIIRFLKFASYTLLCGYLSFILPSCATIKSLTSKPPERQTVQISQEELNTFVATLSQLNHGLVTFKGTGKLTISSQGSVRSFRMAWMGENPETVCVGSDGDKASLKKLRVELIAPYGKPAMSFSYDGEWIYLYSHNERSFIQKHPEEFDISYLFDIPISISDLICLLSGRPPLKYPEDAEIDVKRDEEEGLSKGPYLVFKKGFLSGWDTVHMTPDNSGFDMVERYDFKGSLKFRATLENLRKKGGFLLPYRITVSEKDGNALFLETTRYFPNAGVNEESFVIKPPAY